MIIASHTMPGPSAGEINTVVLLTVLGPVLVSCLLIALVNPSYSLARRVLAAVTGIAIGTTVLTLSISIALFLAVMFAAIVEDASLQVAVAVGVVLLAVPGAFCIAIAARVTQAMCIQWRSDLIATHVPGSSDRLLASGWAIGLLIGLIATLTLDRFVLLGIGAIGGTLIAAGFNFRERRRGDCRRG